MKMAAKNYRADDFSVVYESLLLALLSIPEYASAPRGQKIHEITNCRLVINDPKSCLFTNERRSSQFKYIAAELLWYLSGDKKLDFISKFSKFWKKLENCDSTVNSNYGWLLFYEKYAPVWTTQWQWAYNSLYNDKDTRQAIMHFNLPKHQFLDNKDFVCTMYGDFLIRDNQLHFTIHMRSNDVILGLPTDIPFFCMLQLNMWRLLKEKKYPDLELGTYTHFVNSMHLYERNFALVEEMASEDFKPMELIEGSDNVLDEYGNHSSFVERFISSYMLGVTPDIHNTFEKFIWDSLTSQK